MAAMGGAAQGTARKQSPVYDENYPNQHQRSNTECGMYSLYFIVTMLQAARPATVWNRRFKRGKIPDQAMIRLRDVYYNDADADTKSGGRRSVGGVAIEEDTPSFHKGMKATVTMGVKRSLLDVLDQQQYKKNDKPYVARVNPHRGFVQVQRSTGSLSDDMDDTDESLAQIMWGKAHSDMNLPWKEYRHSMDVPGLAKRRPRP
jgi:hypothetical protein